MSVRILLAWDKAKNGYTKFYVDGDYDGEYLAQYDWYIFSFKASKKRHVKASNGDLKGRYLSDILMPKKKGYVVYHKNDNDLDYRSENLGYITQSDFFLKYRPIHPPSFFKKRKNNSGFRGVYFDARQPTNKYKVVVARKYRGSYPTASEAAIVADREMINILGYDRVKNVLNYPNKWEEK